MAKSKGQKTQDLEELTSKLKDAKGIVFTGYSGTTVKDLDTFRKALRKENVFSKVYKMTLVKKALEAVGIKTDSVEYKTPVILSISQDEETAPARVIKNLAKDIKTISMLEGVVEGKVLSKAEVEALGDLPGKDQLRAQFLSVLNGPISAFVRLLDAYGKKLGEGSASAPTDSPAGEPVAEKPAEQEPVAQEVAAEQPAPASEEAAPVASEAAEAPAAA